MYLFLSTYVPADSAIPATTTISLPSAKNKHNNIRKEVLVRIHKLSSLNFKIKIFDDKCSTILKHKSDDTASLPTYLSTYYTIWLPFNLIQLIVTVNYAGS